MFKKVKYSLLIFILLFSSCNCLFPELTSEKIDVKDAYSYLKKHKGDEDVALLDIRTKEEYDKGHLENSLLMDYTQTNFPAEIEKLDRDKRYIIYCANGKKSMNTIELMKELRFDKAHSIIGGLDEWKKQGLPMNY